MRRVALLLFVSVGWFLASAPPSEAAFVSGFTGNSALTSSTIAGGWVNFAVYDTYASGTNNWITDLGLTGQVTGWISSQAVTGTERYAFFYQVMRNSVTDGSTDITFSAIDAIGATWSGVGALNNRVFNDANDGATGPAGTVLTNLDAVTPFVFFPPTPDPVTNNVGFADLTLGGTRGRISAFDPPLDPLEFSSILVLTSNVGPDWGTFATGFGQNPGPTAIVPVATPEPGSLVLLGLAMVVGGAGYGWKRRKQKAAEQQSS